MEKEMIKELKEACLKVWEKYKNSPWNYYQEKVSKVNDYDSANRLIGMFDSENLAELKDWLSDECREYYDYILGE